MSQVTIYLHAETDRRVREAAAAAGVSVSKWIAGLIEKQTASAWPDDVAALAGSWPAMPDAAELRRSLGPELPRELL